MPRGPNGAYTLPPGTTALAGKTIESAKYNAAVNDLAQDNNTARPVAQGGTGATNPTQARKNLGVELGVEAQPYDAGLKSMADQTTVANQMLYTLAPDLWATTTLTPFGRTLIDDNDAAGARATLQAQRDFSLIDTIEMGAGITGLRNIVFDMHVTDDADFNARIVRFNSVNGVFSIAQTGAGALQVAHNGTGAIQLDGGSDIFRNGAKIWHGGNDGAGSGLDADLWRGLAPSAFVKNDGGNYGINISGAAAYAAGAGLANNSDNLGGQGPAFYRNAGNANAGTFDDARLPSTMSAKTIMDRLIIRSNAPILEWRETDVAGTAAWYGVMDGVGLSFRYQDLGAIFLDMQPTGVFQWMGNKIWHAGNDGAGSGLDADLLDGQSSGYFTDIPARLGFNPADRGRSITAGAGLTGGGDLTADRSIGMGTPSSITNGTGNSATGTTHTHAIGFVAAEVYTGSDPDNLVFPLGESLLVRLNTGITRNAAISGIYLTSGSTQSYSNTVNGTPLSGIWRARGMDANTGAGTAKMKRTA